MPQRCHSLLSALLKRETNVYKKKKKKKKIKSRALRRLQTCQTETASECGYCQPATQSGSASGFERVLTRSI
jgi:hypothetical protein